MHRYWDPHANASTVTKRQLYDGVFCCVMLFLPSAVTVRRVTKVL